MPHNILGLTDVEWLDDDAELLRFRAQEFELGGIVGILAIEGHRDLVELWREALEDAKPLADQLRSAYCRAGDIRAGPLETLDHPDADRVEHGHHDDGDRLSRPSCSAGCCDVRGEDGDRSARRPRHYSLHRAPPRDSRS